MSIAEHTQFDTIYKPHKQRLFKDFAVVEIANNYSLTQ